MEAGWLDASHRGALVVRFTPDYVVSEDNGALMTEAVNAQIFADNEARSLADILADLQAAQAAVLAAVEALSEDELNDPARLCLVGRRADLDLDCREHV